MLFQSTLPHGERLIASMMRTTIEVSIHAPTWGATNGGERTKEYIPVSIHAPTWGATFILFSFLFLNVFQSTLPHGERLLEVRVKHKCSVSIHAPTWGATVDILTSGTFELFQSTLPHGERLPRTCRTRSIIGFNPRSHMGSDCNQIKSRIINNVSIHAPTWGATVHPL